MDFSKVCRTCLSEEDLKPIFTNSDDATVYSNTIFVISGVKIEPNDGLPQKMCSNCLDFLNQSSKFRQTCKETENQLRKFIEINKEMVKSETEIKIKTASIKIENKSPFAEDDVKADFTDYDTLMVVIETEDEENDDKPLKCLIDPKLKTETSDAAATADNTKLIKTKQKVLVTKGKKPLPPGRNRRTTCHLCDQDISIRSVDSHMINKHPGADHPDKRKVKCDFCNNFLTKRMMPKHIKLAHSENASVKKTTEEEIMKRNRRIACKICNKDISVRSLDSHMIKMHPGEDHPDNKIKCDLCETFVIECMIPRHMRMMHSSGATKVNKDYVRKRNIRTSCKVCNKAISVRSLPSHMLKKHSIEDNQDANKMQCDICQTFVRKYLMSRHMRMLHSNVPKRLNKDGVADKNRRISCKLCSKDISIRSLDTHMINKHPGVNHPDDRKIKCDLCEAFVIKYMMTRHIRMVHTSKDGGASTWRCAYCKTQFDSKELVARHIKTCSVKKKPTYVWESGKTLVECDICHKKLQKSSLRIHKEVKHQGLGPICQHCGHRFANNYRLNEHYRAKHGYKKFKCSICDHEMAGIRDMRVHERRHRGEKPFVCETCGASFHGNHLLIQHKQSHRTEKLAKHCGHRFANSYRLNEHYRAKHGYKKLKCSFCDHETAGIRAMQDHERRHRGEKPFVCESCGASFHASHLLAQHRQSHRTERLVKCDLCPATFKVNNALNTHKMAVHRKSLHKCGVCSHTFNTRHYALKHLRRMHGHSGAAQSLLTRIHDLNA